MGTITYIVVYLSLQDNESVSIVGVVILCVRNYANLLKVVIIKFMLIIFICFQHEQQ